MQFTNKASGGRQPPGYWDVKGSSLTWLETKGLTRAPNEGWSTRQEVYR